MGDRPAFPGERLVVVSSPFFPHKLSEGYTNPMTEVVKCVNGIPIKNLAHMVQVLRDRKDEFVTFDFDNRFGETLIYRRDDIVAATDDILTDNGIRSQGTPDEMNIWNAKPAATEGAAPKDEDVKAAPVKTTGSAEASGTTGP
jgi:hypothetical protein